MIADAFMRAIRLRIRRVPCWAFWRRAEMEISEPVRDLMADSAEAFLRAGGSITLAEWATLSNASRASLVEAGNRIRAEALAGPPAPAARKPDTTRKVLEDLASYIERKHA